VYSQIECALLYISLAQSFILNLANKREESCYAWMMTVPKAKKVVDKISNEMAQYDPIKFVFSARSLDIIEQIEQVCLY